MGVAHLITYLDSQTGGMERQALQLVQRLQEKGCAIFFITCAHRSEMKRKALHVIDRVHGIPVYRIPLWEGKRRLNSIIYFLGAFALLVWFRRRYTLIHAHQLYTSGVIASCVKRVLPSKKVVVKNACGGSFGDILFLKRLPWSRYIIRMMRDTVDRFIGVSSECVQEMEAVGFSNISLFTNGVASDYFVPIRSPEQKCVARETLLRNAHLGKSIILFVGRLHPQKNVEVIIRAMNFLSDTVMLLIVGSGEQESFLKDLAERDGKGEHVVFCGAVKDVNQYYQAADVFVLPSHAEGMPNTLLEAMSSGLPVIGSDIPAIKSIITHESNGYLFQKDDPHELAQYLARIIDSPDEALCLGSAARATIEQRFSFSIVIEQYYSLYRAVWGE